MASGELVWHRPLDKGGVRVRVWSGFSADVRNDILLVATSNPGGLVSPNRDAEDFSVSIVAVNAGDGSISTSGTMSGTLISSATPSFCMTSGLIP